MKFKLIILALMASIMTGPVGADSQTKIAASLKNTNPKTIEVICPDFIALGPTNLQSGWEATNTFPMSFLSLKIKLAGQYTRQQMVVCWYGDGKNALAINYKVTAGYSCKASDTNKSMAVCKLLWK